MWAFLVTNSPWFFQGTPFFSLLIYSLDMVKINRLWFIYIRLYWGNLSVSVSNQRTPILRRGNRSTPVGNQRFQVLKSMGSWFCGRKPVHGKRPLAINGVGCARRNITSLNHETFLLGFWFQFWL